MKIDVLEGEKRYGDETTRTLLRRGYIRNEDIKTDLGRKNELTLETKTSPRTEPTYSLTNELTPAPIEHRP